MQHTNAGSLAIKKTPWTYLTVDEFETLLDLCETTFTERPLGSVITHYNSGQAEVMIRDIFQIMHYIHFVHNESEFVKRPKDSPDHESTKP